MNVFKCRRSVVALYAITALAVLGGWKGAEVATAIATIALGVAGANAFEKSKTNAKPTE